MTFLIGTDEAGYGPNLGPLVISATVWHVADDAAGHDLYCRLKPTVCRKPPAKNGHDRVAIADSKLLYKPPNGIGLLERSVLAALSLIDVCPDTWRQAFHLLDADQGLHMQGLPWHDGYELPLPIEADVEHVAQAVAKLRQAFDRGGVRLVAIRSCVVFPDRFNELTERYGNKAEALSQLTLGLVAQLLPTCEGEPILIVCDKHGGRNRYGRLLQLQFPEPLVETRLESLPLSVYRWGPDERRVEIQFRVGGEEFLPAALASMVSKYLRELAMRAFNDFWREQVPELRPTAGYYNDARRFKSAILAAQTELGIEDRVLWRSR